MSPNTPNTPPPEGGDEKDIGKKLKKRLLIAGGLVALALAAIPVLDHFSKRNEVAMTATEPQNSSGKIGNIASTPAAEPSSAMASSAPTTAEASQPTQQAAVTSPTPPPPSHATPPAPDTSKTPGVAAIHEKAPPAAPIPKAPATTTPKATAPPPSIKEENTPHPQAFKPPAPSEATAAPLPAGKAKPVGSSLGYKIQLGLFSNLANAQKLVDELKANGIEAHTETRVHVGPFRTRTEAEEAINKLRQLGYNPMLAPVTQ